jgi:hypothetical protein
VPWDWAEIKHSQRTTERRRRIDTHITTSRVPEAARRLSMAYLKVGSQHNFSIRIHHKWEEHNGRNLK